MANEKEEGDGAKPVVTGGLGRRPFIIGSLASIGVAAIGVRCSKYFMTAPLDPSAIDLHDYHPQAFDAEQWQFLLAACDRLIPGDSEGPGAIETNVPIFIDRQMLTPYGQGQDWYMEGPFNSHASRHFGYQMPFNLQTLYRKGIALTNQYTRQAFGKVFSELSAQQKDTVLSDLEKNHIDFAQFGEADLNAGYFFVRLLDNTKEGYLADPQYGGNKGMAAWLMINFPGARASFPDWISQHNVVYPLKPVSLDGTQA